MHKLVDTLAGFHFPDTMLDVRYILKCSDKPIRSANPVL